MIWPEIITGLLGLAGAVGVLKKGQADMERSIKEWREEINFNFDLIRVENKEWRDTFHTDLALMRETSQRLDRTLAVTQGSVDRMTADTITLRTDIQNEIRRCAKAITVIEIWKAAANQELRQLDQNWEGA